MMKRLLKFFIFTSLYCSIAYFSTAQQFLDHWDNIIQITGTTMTADSLRAVPDVVITVKNKDRGVLSNDHGLFSIACEKGDTLQFTALGFRSKEYPISTAIKGKYFNMVQLMVQDTFYLPETIIKPIPSGKAFDYAFKYWDIGEDQYELAKENMNEEAMWRLMQTLPKNGAENQSAYQRQQAQSAYYYGQVRRMNILNPFKWNEFFEAWKRGDFRKKH